MVTLDVAGMGHTQRAAHTAHSIIYKRLHIASME